MNLRERAQRLKTDIPAVFLCLRSKETPTRAKVVAAVAVVYALSPIDLIPDFIPVLGLLDDLIVVPALIAWTIRLIPPETFARFRREAETLWPDGQPKKWTYAIPFLVVWGLVLFLVVKAICF